MDFIVHNSKAPDGTDKKIRPFLVTKLKRLDSRISPQGFAKYLIDLNWDHKHPKELLKRYLRKYLPARTVVSVYRGRISLCQWYEGSRTEVDLVLPSWLSRLTEKFADFEEVCQKSEWPACDLDERGSLRNEVLYRWVMESE